MYIVFTISPSESFPMQHWAWRTTHRGCKLVQEDRYWAWLALSLSRSLSLSLLLSLHLSLLSLFSHSTPLLGVSNSLIIYSARKSFNTYTTLCFLVCMWCVFLCVCVCVLIMCVCMCGCAQLYVPMSSTAWNSALQCEDSPGRMKDFFLLSYQVSVRAGRLRSKQKQHETHITLGCDVCTGVRQRLHCIYLIKT